MPAFPMPQAVPAHPSESLAPLGLAAHALHEFYAAAGMDGAGLTGAALAMAQSLKGGATLWVRHAVFDRETGAPYFPGLAEFGVDPARLILFSAWDAASVLQAGLEGARCAGLGAVVIELWGEARAYDLTASRRLAAAARESGKPVILTRMAAEPRPSTAETRWRFSTLASRALEANAPGNPAFELNLLRARDGRQGLRLHLEWDRNARCFKPLAVGASRLAGSGEAGGLPAPLSRAVVQVPADRADAADAGPPPFRRAG